MNKLIKFWKIRRLKKKTLRIWENTRSKLECIKWLKFNYDIGDKTTLNFDGSINNTIGLKEAKDLFDSWFAEYELKNRVVPKLYSRGQLKIYTIDAMMAVNHSIPFASLMLKHDEWFRENFPE